MSLSAGTPCLASSPRGAKNSTVPLLRVHVRLDVRLDVLNLDVTLVVSFLELLGWLQFHQAFAKRNVLYAALGLNGALIIRSEKPHCYGVLLTAYDSCWPKR